MFILVYIYIYTHMKKSTSLSICVPTWNDLNWGHMVRGLGFLHLSGKLHFAET